jgi:hypothetical protein
MIFDGFGAFGESLIWRSKLFPCEILVLRFQYFRCPGGLYAWTTHAHLTASLSDSVLVPI